MSDTLHTATEWNDILDYGIVDYDGFRDGDITPDTRMTEEEFRQRAVRSTRVLTKRKE